MNRAGDGHRGASTAPPRRPTPLLLGLVALAWLTALTQLSGCGAGPAPWAASAEDVADYDAALATWTRHDQRYAGFEARVYVHATWFSPQFAAAHAARQNIAFGRDRGQVDSAVRAAIDQAQSETRFFVTLATANPDWNDLDETDPSLEIQMRSGAEGGWVKPTSIKRLRLNAMSDRQVLFPHATDLTVGYDVVFPPPADKRRVELRIAGLPARIDLVWETR